MKKLAEKPTKKHVHEPAFDYHDVIDWIEQKYGINTRDFAGSFGPPPPEEYRPLIPPAKKEDNGRAPYLDFWHWILDNQFYGDVHNGSYQTLVCISEEGFEDEWAKQPAWVNKIFELINAEFPEEEGALEVWIAW